MTTRLSFLHGLTLGIAVFAASAAGAAVLDVSPSGTGTACTPGSPCALATANSNVQPGDVVRMAPGTYTTPIAPARDGSAAGQITYLGSITNPTAVVVPSSTVTRRYISVKGMRFNNAFHFDRTSATQYAEWDTIGWCVVDNDFGVDQAKHCVAYRVDVVSGKGHFSCNVPSVPVASYTIPEFNTIRRCRMWLGEDQTYGQHVVQIKGMQSCTLDSNQVYITMSPNITAETDPFIAFYMKYCTFKDNKWVVRSNHNAAHLFRWRDSTMFNRVYRDTIIMSGYVVRFAPSSSGSWPGTTDQNYFEGLYVKSSCVPGDVALFYQNGSRRDTLRNCVVIDSVGKAIQMLSIEKGTTLIDHCTFVGEVRYGAADFPCGQGSFGDAWPATGRMVFTNNIVYGISTGAAGTNADVNWQFSSTTNDLTSNNNLYYTPGLAASTSIRYGVNSGSATFSAPGTGSAFYSAWGEDGQSLSADPLFANASFTNFDPRLQPGSPAIGAAMGGLDIGAIVSNGPDAAPPADVTDLRAPVVSDRNVMLAWTAPGDDGTGGARVSQYEVRWSTSAITAANFASATLASPEPPITVNPGGVQTYGLTGLAPGVTYWVAMRSRDDASNWSRPSNILSFTTSTTDVTPPAPVQDLTTSP